MPRILHVIDSLGMGGKERQLSLLLNNLPPFWVTRTVALGGGPFESVLRGQSNVVNVFNRKYRHDLVPVFNLWRIIWDYKPDIIHAWGGISSAVCIPICKFLKIKMIDSIRSTKRKNPPLKSRLRYLRSRIVQDLADKVIGNSQAGLNSYKISPLKGKIIYNAIDPSRFDAFAFQCKDKVRNQVTVIMAARMSPQKDFNTFIKAARIISKNHQTGWRFIALGSGELRKDLIKYAEDLISKGVLEFPEPTLEIIPYLLGSDIGVLMTNVRLLEEGFSNTITEYMACGLPVVCSDSGGNRELVKQNETGYMIPAFSIDDLVDKLLFLRNHPLLAKRMGTIGRERVNHMCSVKRMIEEYETVYKELLGPRK
jgi:glycosyltransferase involved in cell wall biosynthesis